MSGVYEILAKIQAKPGLYIGRPSVSDLFMFLVGYECSRSELGIENTEYEEDFYGEFQPWLQKKLGITTVSSWAKMIMLYCHDERAGFEKFFNLLDEFKQRNQNLDANEVNNISEVVVTAVKH
ncbi:hypothetical protein WA1_26165 [Scytonema hofmannii PCC 7110]|uniref:Uncharacterized protein n=1 Tax=Scytonema hofmannii PCC 7110 TaxID=128403 RepID=A0A139X7G6_9CYAN|nr:hypothetical protein [Scytonema hofmannii]KYC40605.1 hypothetical protein WA1_26165 [Scytonema hofmannii PCC 7110]